MSAVDEHGRRNHSPDELAAFWRRSVERSQQLIDAATGE